MWYIALAVLILLLPAAIRLFLCIWMLFGVRAERCQVYHWIPLDAVDEPPTLTSYHFELDRQAAALGFQQQTVVKQARRAQWSSIWLAPDGCTVLLVMGGLPHKRATQRTILATRMSDGMYIETTDVPALRDLTGMYDVAFLLNADLFELQELHKARLIATETEPASVEAGRIVEVSNASLAAAADRLVEVGYAAYLDPARSEYRYTWRGAWRVAWKEGREMLAIVRKQQHRAAKKRPGVEGYVSRDLTS